MEEEKEGGCKVNGGPEDRSAQEKAGNKGGPKKLFKWNEEIRSDVLNPSTEMVILSPFDVWEQGQDKYETQFSSCQAIASQIFSHLQRVPVSCVKGEN